MKKRELLTVILFCGFLFAMLLGYLLLPKAEFSETEKRFLAETPALRWDAVASGDWGTEAETYMADHIPFRDFFVGLNAYFELYTGRQVSDDVWLRDGRLLESPAIHDDAAIQRNLKAINNFAASTCQEVDLMIVPSAGWAAGEKEYTDSAILEAIENACGAGVTFLPMADVYRDSPELFYRTDHHWNSEGAYRAYEAWMTAKNRPFRTEQDFERQLAGTFFGSTYSRSALWLTDGEELELWLGSENLTVTTEKGTHEGVFYMERLEEADKYTVFLDGNHPIVRITNPGQEGKLLVIRDSYANSLGCFLAESYGEVVLVDLRYYRQSLSQLVQEEGFADILVCYSLKNFLSDTNLMLLR